VEEIWKPIEGYEGLYEVSNLGRVRSLEFRNNHSVSKRTKFISATDNGHGYLIVGLRKEAKRKNYYVHRLVAKAFIPNPDNLPVIDHIDHDRSNNVATNLQWITQGDNVRRSRHLMRKPKNFKTNTGENYISKQSKDGLFRVTLRQWETGCRKQIGVFDTLEEAKEARDEALKKAEFIPNR
jgi:hypothetical protein